MKLVIGQSAKAASHVRKHHPLKFKEKNQKTSQRTVRHLTAFSGGRRGIQDVSLAG